MKWLPVALLCGSAAVAQAQHAEGDYGGAVPGAGQREKHHTSHAPNTLTWVGFQKMGEAPRVFLRVTSAATPEQQVAGDELIVRLPGFKLDTKNNGRPLNTKFFGTDVLRVRVAATKGGLELRVTFAKGAHEAKVSSEPAPEADGGGLFVYLDL